MKKNGIFKSVEDSIALEKKGYAAESGFQYVFNSEETEFDFFDLNGDIEAQLEEIEKNSYKGVKIVESEELPFDEFTSVICDAFLVHNEY